MDPIGYLMDEHAVIGQVVTCLEKISHRALVRGMVDTGPVEDAMNFLQTFLMQAHMQKEEQGLFAYLEKRGIRYNDSPVREMSCAHDTLRARLDGVVESLASVREEEPGAVRSFAGECKSFVGILRTHALVEEACLYDAARKHIAEVDQFELVEAFEAIDRDSIGFNALQHCLGSAERLGKHFQVPRSKSFRPARA